MSAALSFDAPRVQLIAAIVVTVALGDLARGQSPPNTSQIRAYTNIEVVPDPNRVSDSGLLDGRNGVVATASDSFTNLPAMEGQAYLGSRSATARATVTGGTIRLFADVSVTSAANNPLNSLGISAGSLGSVFDTIEITGAPAGGSIAIASVIDPVNAQGNFSSSGGTWVGTLSLSIMVQKYPAGGGSPMPAGTVMQSFHSGSSQGPGSSNSGPDRIPVAQGDTLTFNVDESLGISALAQNGQTAEAMGDFGHTTHIYIWSLTPGVQFTTSSGSDYAPLAGDANLDGQVSFADLLTLAQHYNATAASWEQGDFNGDGKVDFSDLLILAQHYGTTAAAALSSVPEPSAGFAIIVCALGMLVGPGFGADASRRRRDLPRRRE